APRAAARSRALPVHMGSAARAARARGDAGRRPRPRGRRHHRGRDRRQPCDARPRTLRALRGARRRGARRDRTAPRPGSRPQARLLALSTDPAHSLGDALRVSLADDERALPGAPGVFARELDAAAAFAVRRERYRASVDEVFDALLRGSRFDVAYDRDVVRELIDLAPPGLDELFGILSLVDALLGRERTAYDIVVLDTAPTGHALRLLAMPDAALEWVHALLAILLKYRAV